MSFVGALPLSIQTLSHKRAWTLEVAPSCFQGDLLPVLSNTLAPAVIQYSHTSDKGVETQRVDCSFPLIPTLFLLSLQFQLSTLFFCTDGLKVLDSWKKEKKESLRYAAMWFLLLLYLELLDIFGIFWRGQKTCGHRRVSQQQRNLKEVLSLSQCVSLNANPKSEKYYKLLARRARSRTAVTSQKLIRYISQYRTMSIVSSCWSLCLRIHPHRALMHDIAHVKFDSLVSFHPVSQNMTRKKLYSKTITQIHRWESDTILCFVSVLFCHSLILKFQLDFQF